MRQLRLPFPPTDCSVLVPVEGGFARCGGAVRWYVYPGQTAHCEGHGVEFYRRTPVWQDALTSGQARIVEAA